MPPSIPGSGDFDSGIDTGPSHAREQAGREESEGGRKYHESTCDSKHLEEEEEALEEEFVSQEHVAEHDRRIYWIHVILGSAVLLPWNGKHQQCSRRMNNTLTSSL